MSFPSVVAFDLWGAKTRCAPEKLAIYRQELIWVPPEPAVLKVGAARPARRGRRRSPPGLRPRLVRIGAPLEPSPLRGRRPRARLGKLWDELRELAWTDVIRPGCKEEVVVRVQVSTTRR
jgi:hypothetical protein